MKKIILILIVSFLLTTKAFSDHKGWPHGKEYAYKCVKEGGCDIDITKINKQPKLFIGKSSFSGNNKPINIAQKGKLIKPTKMIGIWGDFINNYAIYDVSDDCQGMSCQGLKWSEYFDHTIYSTPSGSDDELIWLNEEFKYEAKDGGEVGNYRHSFPISHLIQNKKLNELKNGLVEGAKNNWIRILQADRFLYKSSSAKDFQGFGNTLNWFYPTITPLIEAHIVLQKNEVYSKEEFDLVHSWLEKRVWALEQGPMDGLLSSQWKWKHFFEPGNHETINKKVAYMLWGVADQNENYFTAGLNGFKDFYKTMRKKNGTFKAEHRSGSGQNFGINSGNKVAQGMIIMAIILHHQGYDIQKEFPKINKLVAWCNKNYKDTKDMGGDNNNMRFLSNNPNDYNTVGWMHLYDVVFDTNYALDFPTETNRMVMYAIEDAKSLLKRNNKNNYSCDNISNDSWYCAIATRKSNPSVQFFAEDSEDRIAAIKATRKCFEEHSDCTLAFLGKK